MNTLNDCATLLGRVREARPLVHHLTNYVTVNDCANVTLAVGASPIMANAIDEAGDIASIASSVVLNIGTLNRDMLASMLAAGKRANDAGVPVVFDPVGAGASALRNEATETILGEVKIAVVRGNISEIRAAGGMASHTKGVDADAGDMTSDAVHIAASLAARTGCIVAITGKEDVVSDGGKTYLVANGNRMLSNISGTGCMCTSLVGAFAGAAPDELLRGAVGALLCMGIAGEIAFEKAGATGIGSYRAAVMDAISLMDGETLLERGIVREAAH